MSAIPKVVVDKEFLEQILKEPISSFELSAGSKLGDNVAGSLQSIKVKLASGKTLNLVNKTLPEDQETLDYAVRFGIFHLEATAYQNVVPRVESVMKSKGASNPKLPVPGYFGGNHELSKGGIYICLEDVRPEGYVMADKFKGLSLPEVIVVMKNMAKYHASTYYWIKYEGEKVFEEDEGLTKMRDSPFIQEDPQMEYVGKLMFSFELHNSIKLLKHRKLDDLAERVQKKLVDGGTDTSYNLFKEVCRRTDKTCFPCIIHGDLWVNNIMFKYDSAGNPVDLRFLDFQQIRRGNIFDDLSYFIMTSTTPEFRKEHLAHVLNVYFEAFSATLEEIKCPIPLGFTRGSLLDTFYQGFLAGYAYMVFAIPLQLADHIDPEVKKAQQAAEAKKNGNGEGPPPNFDPSSIPMEEMMKIMAKNLETRSQAFYGQMLKSPKAIDRLVALTEEMAGMNLF